MDVKSWVPVDFYKACQSNGTFSVKKYEIEEFETRFADFFICFSFLSKCCFESEFSVFGSGTTKVEA